MIEAHPPDILFLFRRAGRLPYNPLFSDETKEHRFAWLYGAIGVSTQKVAADLPEQIRIVGMASRENVDGMEEAIRQFKPLAVGMTDPAKAKELQRRVGGKIPCIQASVG